MEFVRGTPCQPGHNDQPTSVKQRAPYFPYRKIKSVRVKQSPHVLLVESEPFICCTHQASHICMGNYSAFRLSSRARRIDEISRVFRMGLTAEIAAIFLPDHLPFGIQKNRSGSI